MGTMANSVNPDEMLQNVLFAKINVIVIGNVLPVTP